MQFVAIVVGLPNSQKFPLMVDTEKTTHTVPEQNKLGIFVNFTHLPLYATDGDDQDFASSKGNGKDWRGCR